MGKTIRVDDDLHEKLKTYNRNGETMAETIERLINGPSLSELYGIIDESTADKMRAAIDDSNDAHHEKMDELYGDEGE